MIQHRDGTEEVQETQMIAVAEIDACEAEKEDFEYLTRNYIYERGTQTIHDACMHNAEVDQIKRSLGSSLNERTVCCDCGALRSGSYLAHYSSLFC